MMRGPPSRRAVSNFDKATLYHNGHKTLNKLVISRRQIGQIFQSQIQSVAEVHAKGFPSPAPESTIIQFYLHRYRASCGLCWVILGRTPAANLLLQFYSFEALRS